MKRKPFPDDRTAPERREDLSDEQMKELELAGGVAGGMRAGSAGGPGSKNEDKKAKNDSA